MTPVELKSLRQEIGTRQKDLAVILGVPFRTYQNWEAGEGTREHRQIPDEFASRVRILAELKKDVPGKSFPTNLVWWQIPLREEEVRELRMRAEIKDKSPSTLIREAIFQLFQDPY